MARIILFRVDDEPADLIDVREAARILGVSRTTVYAAIEDGRLNVYVREWDDRQKVRRSDVERMARYKRRPRRGNNHSAEGTG